MKINGAEVSTTSAGQLQDIADQIYKLIRDLTPHDQKVAVQKAVAQAGCKK